MIGHLLLPEIQELIREKDFAGLKKAFQEWQCADLAEVISDLPETEQVTLFRLLPPQSAAGVFEYLSLERQEALLHAMGHEQSVVILNEMSADDRTALLEELPDVVVTKILQSLNPNEQKVARQLLGYPENTVGRLMTPEFIAIQDHWTMKEVLDYVREHGRDSETLNVIYVVDANRKLIDDIRIREVLLKPLDAKVSEVRSGSFVALKPTEPKQDAVQLFKKYDRSVLPVTDSEGRLVGIVTIDDVLDIVEERATEEIQKLGAVEALDEPYLTISLWNMVKKRAHWLVILFFGEMLTATAMGYFENEIQKEVVLALFVPLIISSGGNSGSQASTLIVRALAVGEVTLRDWWHIMRREIVSGLALGAILGSIGFLRIALWSVFSTIYGPQWFLVALVVSLSLVGVVLWGTISGSMLPLILKRCGADPATSSAPFVATLVDVTGLIIYFTIAALILLKAS